MYRILLLFLSFFIIFPGYTNSIKVSPTRIDLSSKEKIATLTVSSPSQNPILIQTELVRWTQENGEDIYTPTERLAVLPSAFSIPPGQKQQLRIALQHPSSDLETAYRLYVREVVSSKESGYQGGLKIALRIGIPIFVEPLTQPIEVLDWEVTQKNNSIGVRLKNNGNVHVLIEELALLHGNTIINQQNTFKYLLPMQSFQWLIPSKNSYKKSEYQIRATINGKSIQYQPLKKQMVYS